MHPDRRDVAQDPVSDAGPRVLVGGGLRRDADRLVQAMVVSQSSTLCVARIDAGGVSGGNRSGVVVPVRGSVAIG
jgi:hypothetical protein